MIMKTEKGNIDSNLNSTQTLNENATNQSPASNQGLKHQNGHCVMSKDELSPNKSENKANEDLSKIFTKVSKGRNITNRSSGNLPGPSQHNSEQPRDPSCGIYYGIKSYLHHFYGPPDKDVLKSGEYAQGDDFRFLAEPRRKGCWVRAGLWLGINLILLGGIALLVGYLTPPHEAVVGQYHEFTILDRWAVNFNYHLIMCQLAGLITLSFGVILVVCSLLVANCQPARPAPTFLVMGAYLPSPVPGKPGSTPAWGIQCIPLSGVIKSVQPQFIGTQY